MKIKLKSLLGYFEYLVYYFLKKWVLKIICLPVYLYKFRDGENQGDNINDSNKNKLVIVLDPSLGIGDIIMLSPLFRCESDIVIISKFGNFFDLQINWIQSGARKEYLNNIKNLQEEGGVFFFPRYGIVSCICMGMLVAKKGMFAGLLNEEEYFNSISGKIKKIKHEHYSNKAYQCMAELLSSFGMKNVLPPLQRVKLKKSKIDLNTSEKFICLAPWATSATRRWPVTKWVSLTEKILQEYKDTDIVVLGNANECFVGEQIKKILPRFSDRIHNLAGKTSLQETVYIISQSQMLLCNDNGLMHIALVENAPVVSVFGSTNYKARMYGERWQVKSDISLCPNKIAPCYKSMVSDPKCPTEIECLDGIRVEDMFECVSHYAKGG